MPRTVNEGFQDFLKKLTPTATETQAAKNHRASIEQCLKNNFGVNRFTRIGSFGNGTSISGHSDVDYLACLPTNQLSSSSAASLIKVKNALATRFPNTGVKVSSPAVIVPFGSNQSEHTEIVPADYLRVDSEHKVYDIPDCSAGWMEASPDAHNSYVRTANDRLNGKVKPLIRFIKAWKYYQNVPISSFYLEMMVAKYANKESSINYAIDVKQILCNLRDNNLSKIQDPQGFSGYISPCKTDAVHQDALSKVKTAASRATNARNSSNDSDAFYWWNLLYNGSFPSYYY